VKPLKNANQPRIGFYTPEQADELLAACEPDFRELVRGALLTGCRHGELRRLDVGDYHGTAGRAWLHIRRAKGGHGRMVFLDEQGAELFERLTAGREPDEPMFLSSMVTGALAAIGEREGRPRIDRMREVKAALEGAPERSRDLEWEQLELLERTVGVDRRELWGEGWRRWRRQSQVRRMKGAAEEVGLQITNFHALRHTYASLLVQAGVPLKFIAEQLGHTSTRMVEEHYGHLAPSVVAEAIATHMPRYERAV